LSRPAPDRLKRHGVLYLATPYTKHRDGRDYAYEEAAAILARLWAEGLVCYSPITHWHHASSHQDMRRTNTTDEWLEVNRPLMRLCGAMVVPDFDDWEASDGIAAEIVDFRKRRRPVYLLDHVLLTVVRRLA
jgi:hypothetical protein